MIKSNSKSKSATSILSLNSELYNYVSILLPSIDLFIISLIAFSSENLSITLPINISFPLLGFLSIKLSEKLNNKTPIFIAMSLMVLNLGLLTYYAGINSPAWIQAVPTVTAIFFLFDKKAIQFLFALACMVALFLSNYFIGQTINSTLTILLPIAVFTVIIERGSSFLLRQQKRIEVQKKDIESKNIEITSSIQYAKRIHEAIMPSLKQIQVNFPKSFVLCKPKDIIAGDFVWFEQLNDRTIIAVADCTGHGVPGALVSIVCSNALNRSIREFNLSQPAAILNKTRELVVETFAKSEINISDGMDIALCTIENETLEYAGANNSLYYIAEQEFIEICSDKQPIGKCDFPKPYTNHKIELKKGDIFYLFTDGFADQFGGPKGKKFKYQSFRKLFIDNHSKPLDEQNNIFNNSLAQWKGDHEQADDICIIGIQL
jgi:serine phosphatase RsbU (regulator of sigma subunit)